MNLRSLFGRPEPVQLTTAIRTAGDGLIREADKDRTIRMLSNAVQELRAVEKLRIRDESEQAGELEEAMRMGGEGPWRMPGAEHGRNGIQKLHESTGPQFSTQGAYGDIELALQNVEWRREVNLSWLEFSRWGIQQIILISRLYYIKNPMIQRGINVASQYVFGRGVEVSSDNDAANEVIQEFWERNKRTLGQIALGDLERRKYYDGNIFFALFSDKTNTGEVNIRTIDATEIFEIVTDPDDSDVPWYYRREWIQKTFDVQTGAFNRVAQKAWYPALSYDPDDKPKTIGTVEVRWDSPVLHRRCGAIGKWHFGCPLVYAALDWAKACKRFLEACMTVRESLAQISMTLTTKGGQQALQGAKQQLSTTVGPAASLWDQNPTAVDASIFASGPGTKIEAFNTKGAGGDPAEVREYKLNVAMVFGLPESFFADMNTSNLATATSLDRPTELNFMQKQEEWREDLVTIAQYVLDTSYGAPSGKLREAMNGTKNVSIREAARVRDGKGRMVYEASQPSPDKSGDIKIMAVFPTIIEADTVAQVGAVVTAMTLGTKTGIVTGIDEREGVAELYRLIGTENAGELLDEQYPLTGPDKYDPLRTKEEPMALDANGMPVPPTGSKPKSGEAKPIKQASAESGVLREAMRRLSRAFRSWEENQPHDGNDGA